MLHVGSAIGLLIFFWRDWVEIVAGVLLARWRERRIETPTEKLAWLIIATTIPTGILGLVLEHPVRVALAKPTAAAVFLMINGLDPARRRAPAPARGRCEALAARYGTQGRTRGGHRSELRAGASGSGFAQSTALIAGISRDGVCMTAGLLRGLDNEDAARFAFLLATPIILAAGIFKFSDLTGPLGAGIRGQAVVAAVCAAIAAIFSVHFLLRYFKTRNLVPFGIYCLAFGAAMVVYTTVT